MPDKKSPAENLPVPVDLVTRRIYVIRGQRVMLDSVGTPVSDAPLCAGLTASRESWGRRLIFLSSLR